MNRTLPTLLSALMAAFALSCGSSDDPVGSFVDQDGGAEAGSDAQAVIGVRGERYCEILLAALDGDVVHVDVYNSFGLNDCPAEAWAQVDAASVKTETGADSVTLNGPRYWLIDAFVESSLKDPTPRVLGGIEMRLAAELVLPLAEAMAAQTPYKRREIQRDTTVKFGAGSEVYELVDPTGAVFDMQSYSVQTTTQTEAELAGLGARLALPEGWTFRSRVLTADLLVTAVDGLAEVVQDDFANTYQLSQQ